MGKGCSVARTQPRHGQSPSSTQTYTSVPWVAFRPTVLSGRIQYISTCLAPQSHYDGCLCMDIHNNDTPGKHMAFGSISSLLGYVNICNIGPDWTVSTVTLYEDTNTCSPPPLPPVAVPQNCALHLFLVLPSGEQPVSSYTTIVMHRIMTFIQRWTAYTTVVP